jgi:hypothetical protein
MESHRSKDKRRNEALNDLIAFFAGTVTHLPEVKLDKLIYIAHLYHYANYGELLTNTRFFSLSFGPHAPIIRSATKRLVQSKSITLMDSRTSSDPVYSNPCWILRGEGPREENLSSPCLKTLREVMVDWGDRPYEDIVDYTTRTIPYLSTPYREPIDWTLSRPFRELKQALSYRERVCIHHFVEEPEKSVQHSNACRKGEPVSISEVAEIYLAVCGEHPDKIPSREYLGFDLQSVLHALDQVEKKRVGGSNKHPAEIEKAAEITDSIMMSLSFRSFSARVALKTGMFYLRKRGYCFDGDVLEEHWPESNSHETILEWYGRMSVKVDTN